MASNQLNSIRDEAEETRDKSLFRVGMRVAANIGGCVENRTEGVIAAVHERPRLTTYEVAFDGYTRTAGIQTIYTATALTRLDQSTPGRTR